MEKNKPPAPKGKLGKAKWCEIGPINAEERREEAYHTRKEAAHFQKKIPLPDHPCNDDESVFFNKIGNYSKGLPHNSLGEVDLKAYQIFLHALKTGKPDNFESIPLGGVVKFSNPQAAYTFELIGSDSHHLRIMVPPSFSSAWEASEIAEVYWQALP